MSSIHYNVLMVGSYHSFGGVAEWITDNKVDEDKMYIVGDEGCELKMEKILDTEIKATI